MVAIGSKEWLGLIVSRTEVGTLDWRSKAKEACPGRNSSRPKREKEKRKIQRVTANVLAYGSCRGLSIAAK